MSQDIGEAGSAQLDRRQFLAGSVAATGAGMASESSAAAPLLAERASVVLHDPRIPLEAAVVQRFEAEGTRVIALDDDPVLLWRSEVGRVLREPGTRLLGITRWADLLIVRGLAAETRRHLRYEKLDAGAGTFTWLIA